MDYITKNLPEISQISLRQLNTVSTFRATMNAKTYKNNKMKCDLIVPVAILNIELQNLFVISELSH